MKTLIILKDQHLIVVDPGSNWEAIRKTIKATNQSAILLTHTLRPYWVLTWSEILMEISSLCSRKWSFLALYSCWQPFRSLTWRYGGCHLQTSWTHLCLSWRIPDWRIPLQSYQRQATLSVEFHWFSQMDTGLKEMPFRETIGRQICQLVVWNNSFIVSKPALSSHKLRCLSRTWSGLRPSLTKTFNPFF